MKAYFYFYNCFICVPIVMLSLALIYFVFLIYLQRSSSTRPSSLNIGTVLFYRSDGKRPCWSKDELALLRSRRVLQGILPPTDAIDINNEEYVDSLLNYFNQAFAIVNRTVATDPNANIISRAMADTVGGYMKYWVLPATRYGFYGGTVSYASAKKLLNYYEDIKSNLNTDGYSWRSPDEAMLKSLQLRVSPAPIPFNEHRSRRGSCKDLAFYETASSELVIPVPHVNWEYKPHMMMVPVESNSLVALQSPTSAYALYNYYTTAQQCLAERQSVKQKNEFELRFQRWAISDVLPHLNDETLYVAFGSILRLMNGTENWIPGHNIYKARLHSFKAGLVPPCSHDDQIRNVIKGIPAFLGSLMILWCAPCLLYCYLKRRRRQVQTEEDNSNVTWAVERSELDHSRRRSSFKRAERSFPCKMVYSAKSRKASISEKPSFENSSKTSSNFKSKASELLLKVSQANFEKKERENFSKHSLVKLDQSTKSEKSMTRFEMDLSKIEADRLSEIINYFSSACTRSDDLVAGDQCLDVPSSLCTLAPDETAPAADTSECDVERICINKSIRSYPDVRMATELQPHDEKQESLSSRRDNERPSRIPQKAQSTVKPRRSNYNT